MPDEISKLQRNLGLVAHMDWSTSPKKRWVSFATRATSSADAHWHIHPALSLQQFLQRTTGDRHAPLHTIEQASLIRARGQGAFIGLDFALGVPAGPLATHAEVASFTDLLDLLIDPSPAWRDFLEPCETPEQISPTRPFYPRTPRGSRRAHLMSGLGVTEWDDLLRACDYAQPGGARPCPLYWTVGANQVGKGTIKGWRELLLPLRERGKLNLWPFDGALHTLLDRIHSANELLFAEVYPAEIYQWLNLDWGSSGKRDHGARVKLAPKILEAFCSTGALPDEETSRQVLNGFGDTANAEDAFDSMVGLAGMLLVLHGAQPLYEPPHDTLTQMLEGWILGRPPEESGEE